jgi:hypothetical protein
MLHGSLESAAGFLDDGAALQFDHRSLDVGVDASKDADEQLVVEQREPDDAAQKR